MASILLHNNSNVLLFTNDSFVVYDIVTELQNQLKIPEPTKSNLKNQNRRVISARYSKDLELLAVVLDNKQLVIYSKEFTVLHNIITNRTCTKIRFTKENDMVLADKTGDVYLYKITDVDNPVLLLGHLSMVLDLDISECGKFLVTCDRDEKIRVSHFPNCYNIMSYCLGHTEFVTNVEVHKEILISGSGDGSIRLWNFLNGKQLSVTLTNEYIQDKSILEKFCLKMDEEIVDIQAVPMVDLKLFSFSEKVAFVGVALLNYNGIQIYCIQDMSNIQFIENIEVESTVISFTLSSQMVILTTENLHLYTLSNMRYIKTNSFNLTKIYSNCNLCNVNVDTVNNIAALYKRKYDNVEEYLQRKKLRLGAK